MSKNLTLKEAVKQLGLDKNVEILIHTRNGEDYIPAKIGKLPKAYQSKKCVGIKKQESDNLYLFIVA